MRIPAVFCSLLFVTLAAPLHAQEVGLELVAEGFAHPLTLVEAPDETGRRFVVDQAGLIYILMPDGTVAPEPFLDVRDRMVPLNTGYDERGLLGLAFHPDFAATGRFFVHYSAPLRPGAPEMFDNTTHISAFSVSEDPDRADPASEQILLQVDQPQGNHAGGTIAFGPEDGYLYIALGDGGGRDDEGTGHSADWYDANAGGNGQDVTQNLLGSILRIDVDNPATGMNYGIPPDNPFVETDGLDEHYAYGFRNPYAFSFDAGGENALIVGDVGQELWEEISVVTRGGNYGWNVKEGAHCFDAENPNDPPADCPDADPEGNPLIDPVIDIPNAKQEGGLGLAVVGGYVYRGSALPAFEGRYFFGVWSGGRDAGGNNLPGRLFTAEPQEEGSWPFSELAIAGLDSLPHFVLGFGQDRAGELYVLTTDAVGPAGTTGRVYRFVAPEDVATHEEGALPEAPVLAQNYPNPFNPSTRIRFELPATTHVQLVVYDLLGHEVKRLLDRPLPSGPHQVDWDGTDGRSRPAASGVYLYRLTAGPNTVTRAMVLLR